MCIEFVYINNSPPTDGYRLIVSNNRDEYYDRPSKSANFWEDRPDCISGMHLVNFSLSACMVYHFDSECSTAKLNPIDFSVCPVILCF